MKIIDFEKRGNLVRLYLGNDNVDDYWGDDWDDAPYEYNAGKVYDKYISAHVDLAFDWKYYPMESAEYNGMESSKEDFKKGQPFLMIVDNDTDNTLLSMNFEDNFSSSVLIEMINGNGLVLINDDTGERILPKVMDVKIY